tara:strand:- start:4850 stop:5167 length:318 start_codon:yes stop_codon:yes gene_type:complete
MTLSNYETTVPAMKEDGAEYKMTASSLILHALNMPKEGGLDVAEMCRRQPLFTKTKATEIGEEFGYTAEELVILKELFTASKWGMFHDDIVALGQAINEATSGKD